MTLLSGFNVRPSHSRVDGCMEPSEVDRLDSRRDQERPGKAVDNDLLNALPTKVADSAKMGMSSDRLRVAVSLAKVADRAGSDLRRWERSSATGSSAPAEENLHKTKGSDLQAPRC